MNSEYPNYQGFGPIVMAEDCQRMVRHATHDEAYQEVLRLIKRQPKTFAVYVPIQIVRPQLTVHREKIQLPFVGDIPVTFSLDF